MGQAQAGRVGLVEQPVAAQFLHQGGGLPRRAVIRRTGPQHARRSLAQTRRHKVPQQTGQHLAAAGADSALQARIESFELAYRMQMTAPEALDLARETKETHALYGLDDPTCGHFAKQCLIARRLVERGVRFVQIYSGGEENQRSWDGHADILGNHSGFAKETDRPIAGLLEDLARRMGWGFVAHVTGAPAIESAARLKAELERFGAKH